MAKLGGRRVGVALHPAHGFQRRDRPLFQLLGVRRGARQLRRPCVHLAVNILGQDQHAGDAGLAQLRPHRLQLLQGRHPGAVVGEDARHDRLLAGIGAHCLCLTRHG
jgi:hypothetical protein